MYPKDLKYLTTHEWARIEGGTATFGITSFAADQLQDLSFLELPGVGDRVSQGESFGQLETVKSVSDLNAPLSGEVLEVNEALQDDLDRLKKDPFGAAWLIKIKLEDPSQAAALLGAEAYEKHCKEEEAAH